MREPIHLPDCVTNQMIMFFLRDHKRCRVRQPFQLLPHPLLGVEGQRTRTSNEAKGSSVKLSLFPYPSIKSHVLGAQKNRLIETVLLSTHNICFD